MYNLISGDIDAYTGGLAELPVEGGLVRFLIISFLWTSSDIYRTQTIFQWMNEKHWTQVCREYTLIALCCSIWWFDILHLCHRSTFLLTLIGWSHLCLFHCRTVSEGYGRGQVNPFDNSVLIMPLNCLADYDEQTQLIKHFNQNLAKKFDSSLVLNSYINPCCSYLNWVEYNHIFFCEVGIIIFVMNPIGLYCI